jgi:Transposase DDE domain group 1
MDEHTEFSSRASLVMVGQQFQVMGLWAVIEKQVQIKQKVRRYTPHQKLLDAFITMLAGGHGLVESNTRVRPEPAIQLAFGRQDCAEQSTISETFNACTPENVEQLRQALKIILHQQGQSPKHDYAHDWQVLDVDMMGLVAGPQAEGATKGYFANQRKRRGRQLGRVLATHYEELVAERLYDGKRQLDASFQELLGLAEAALDLTENKRKRTIVRADGGAGSEANINWALAQGYQLLTKVHSWQRARKLAQTVTQWYADPKVSDREIGWVEQPTHYRSPTRQIAVRHPKKDKQGQVTWHAFVLVFNLSDDLLFELSRQPKQAEPKPFDILLAALAAYDLRGGGLETQNRGSQQGLGLTHRNKRSFAAQEMLVLLAQLAHNLIIWSRNRLAAVDPCFRKFGLQRMVRDLFQISGQVRLAANGQVLSVALNPRHPYTAAFQRAFDE